MIGSVIRIGRGHMNEASVLTREASMETRKQEEDLLCHRNMMDSRIGTVKRQSRNGQEIMHHATIN
jgi:hypothetical protein